MSSMFAGTLREAISGMSADSQDEVNIKLKPMQQAAQTQQALGSNPQLPSATGTSTAGLGTGGISALSAGPQAAQQNAGGNVPAFQSSNPSGLTGGNLQLSTAAPLGSQTDSIYEAAAAQLAQATQQKHLEYLRQLGYLDPSTGQIIPGTLETEAVRQRYELNRQLQEQQREVDEAASRGGTVFSGRRAQLQGLRTEPFYQKLAATEQDLARAMSEGLQNITGLQSQFTVDRNLLIAEAAERARQRAIEQQQLAAAAAASAPAGPGPGWDPGGSPEDMAARNAALNPPPPPSAPQYAPVQSVPSGVPMFDVGGGNLMAGGELRAWLASMGM